MVKEILYSVAKARRERRDSISYVEVINRVLKEDKSTLSKILDYNQRQLSLKNR